MPTALFQQSVKEASRPFLQREPGQIGIYIDVMEAVQNEQRHGSEHYYVMLLTETLYQAFRQTDLALIKGFFEKENVCHGIILDEFREGIVLLASPENKQALEQLKNVYESDKLCQILQRALITDHLLTSLRATMVTIRIRMWQDEYDSCKSELPVRQIHDKRIQDSEADMATLRRVKEAQGTIATHILDLRDGEDKFEQTLGDFINILKNQLKQPKVATSSLKCFRSSVELLRKENTKAKVNFEVLEHFFAMVKNLRRVYSYVEKELWFPLAQIHTVCENEKQREVKQNILRMCRDTTLCLTEDNDLNKISHTAWEGKILPREKEIVFGPISLIPMAISRLSDLDLLFDEYLVVGEIRILNKS